MKITDTHSYNLWMFSHVYGRNFKCDYPCEEYLNSAWCKCVIDSKKNQLREFDPNDNDALQPEVRPEQYDRSLEE